MEIVISQLISFQFDSSGRSGVFDAVVIDIELLRKLLAFNYLSPLFLAFSCPFDYCFYIFLRAR